MTAVVLNKTECNLLKEILNLNTGETPLPTTTTTTITMNDIDTNNTNNNNSIAKQIDDIENSEEFRMIIREKLKNNHNLDLVSLKYLYKLLKFYKLEHYMSDLIDFGFNTAISLNELNNFYYEKLNVSAYDLKKFSKLQAFISQVMSTLKTNNNNKPSNMKSKLQQQTSKNVKFSSSTSTLTSTPSSSSGNNIGIPTWENKSNNVNNVKMKAINSNQKSVLNKRANAKPLPTGKNIGLSRSKSVEPNFNDAVNNNNNNNNEKAVPSVCHPAPVTYMSQKYKKSKNSYFGPQLKMNQVEHVEMKNYNYGVPKSQQQQHDNKKASRSSSAGVKHRKQVQNDNNSANDNNTFEMADIYVFARKRPKLACEVKMNDVVIVEDPTIVINEAKCAVDGTEILRQNEFAFDRIFDSTFNNEDIFNSSVLPFIEDTNNRVDFSCICFGQTGSGKTHTLFGSKNTDGLCVMTVEALFSQNERLLCGFYEIYNGQLYDLFNQNSRLVLREDSNGLVNVVGLVELQIKSITQLKKAIETGQANRHIGCTSFNKASSRSHAVIQIRVANNAQTVSTNQIHRPQTAGSSSTTTPKTKSFRVLFIDLAGSERGIDAQNNEKDNRKEGAEINQSLLALKECIRCIDQFQTHAPFRQSKLTRVLRDCFIGCSRTVLIATVSPTHDSVQYSLNTLQYANRVRQMTMRGKKKYEKNLRLRTNSNNNFMKSNFIKNELKPTVEEQNNALYIVSASSRKLLGDKHEEQAAVTVRAAAKQTVLLEFENPKFKASPAYHEESLSARPMKSLMEQYSSSYKDLSSNTHQQNATTNNVTNTGVPALFHPSKINMASTPIKAGRLEKRIENFNDSLLEDDMPIKGYKVKQQQQQPHNNGSISDTKQQSNSKNNDRQTRQPIDNKDLLNKKVSAVDVESIEKNKPAAGVSDREKRRINTNERHLKRFSHLYSPLSSNNSSFKDENSSIDERDTQKKGKKFGNGSLNNSDPTSSNNNDKSFEAQHQLKFYIQSLEKKLANLRTEMKDSSVMSLSQAVKKPENNTTANNRSIFKEKVLKKFDSDESVDSMKEIPDAVDVKQMFNLNHNNNNNNNKNQDEKFMTPNLSPASTFESSDDSHLSPDSGALKKSLHKSAGNDSLYERVKAVSATLASSASFTNHHNSQVANFTPIINNNGNNKVIFLEDRDANTNDIKNPIPIRYSSTTTATTSSADSKFESAEFRRLSLDEINNNNNNQSNNFKILQENEIWKSTTGNHGISAPNTFRSANSISDDINLKCALFSIESNLGFKDTASNFRRANTLNNNNHQVSPHTLQRTRSLLVVAHENQLSDITETCKEEMGLLMSLKDSQMEFTDYLDKVEEMLNKKAHSIRDFQQQISQLKTINKT